MQIALLLRRWLGIDDIRNDLKSIGARVDMTIMLQLRAHTQEAERKMVREQQLKPRQEVGQFDFQDTL